jgi:tetratricopeptide (TPR) repeat protein
VRTILFCAALWVVLAPAKSQSQSNNAQPVIVKGQIETRASSNLTVQLYDIGSRSIASSAYVAADGSFELRAVPPGSYSVRVLNDMGEELYQTFLNAGSQPGMPLVIHLTEKPPAQPGSGTVSVHELQHAPPRKAYDAAVQAQHFSEAGDFARAAGALEKAVALAPDYADAHSNLGAQYLRLGRYMDSLTETERAIVLGGPTSSRLSNRAIAELHLNRNAEALENATAAARLAPDSAVAQYVLGLALLANQRASEAKTHLEIAAQSMPAARDTLQRLTTRR